MANGSEILRENKVGSRIEEVKRGRRVLTEFAPAANDRAVEEPRIDCEELP
ncbi:hypothetical protein ALC60_09979 [Trachymyrmex zeteki]|uniref:Uncharacterized protein n=1 Tax=Mycetomoellerius zeteki TaxID=64791 RepID=A0A151WSJ0_9HYME|nr:hypothetical protein ALC60_09979 [Trachymyrmex zeteki]